MRIPLISAGVMLVLCVGCMMISTIASIANVNTNGNAYTQSAPAATSTPAGTPTPTPTPIPTATATPLPIGVGDHMRLGHDYSQDSSGDFSIVSPADHFSSGSELAYVIRLDSAIGTLQVHMLLTRVYSGGSESVVYSVPVNVADPTYTEFANKFSTGDLMTGQPAGNYKLKLSDGSSIRASAAFTYVG